MNTQHKIKEILVKQFNTILVEVVDDSAKHAGHAESIKSGGGHYRVKIISDEFKEKNLMQRHRLVYAALKTEMTSSIHALSIQANTPEELST